MIDALDLTTDWLYSIAGFKITSSLSVLTYFRLRNLDCRVTCTPCFTEPEPLRSQAMTQATSFQIFSFLLLAWHQHVRHSLSSTVHPPAKCLDFCFASLALAQTPSWPVNATNILDREIQCGYKSLKRTWPTPTLHHTLYIIVPGALPHWFPEDVPASWQLELCVYIL